MAFLVARGSCHVNGVSKLHGEVSREIFQPLFARWPQEQVPIRYVTNGVHTPTWESDAAVELWTAACSKEAVGGRRSIRGQISGTSPQGINTPRRPWEACGTSGMKVLANGGLNLSEIDVQFESVAVKQFEGSCEFKVKLTPGGLDETLLRVEVYAPSGLGGGDEVRQMSLCAEWFQVRGDTLLLVEDDRQSSGQ